MERKFCMNKNEGKYFYTASLMAEALIELLDKKDFEYITVKELCKKAGVNRSTFYLHYENMNDLLEDTKNIVNKKFHSYFETQKANDILKSKETDDFIFLSPKYLRPYLNFIYDNKKIFQAYFDKKHNFNSADVLNQWNIDLFEPIMNKFDIDKNIQPFLLRYYCSGIISIITKWINDDFKISIDEILEIIMYCLSCSINNIK